ncbi:unannotated protein [freshwater metagenome]|uniref:Unannotated protein n=1 Tax=freshwater metagenome TaxID=449393 RepID=A0A6J7KIW8_9ZZZZ
MIIDCRSYKPAGHLPSVPKYNKGVILLLILIVISGLEISKSFFASALAIADGYQMSLSGPPENVEPRKNLTGEEEARMPSEDWRPYVASIRIGTDEEKYCDHESTAACIAGW